MSKIRIAVRMQPVNDPADTVQFKAAVPMGVLFEKSLDPVQVENERSVLEEKYRILVETLRAMRPALRERNVLKNWMFGDVIFKFEQETGDTLMFIENLSADLARDVNYSKTMIDLCRRLRKHFADSTQLDLALSFDEYHRNGFDPARAPAAHVLKPRAKKK